MSSFIGGIRKDQLRNLNTKQEIVFVEDVAQPWFFKYDSSDTTTADDDISVIVAAPNRRYKRIVLPGELLPAAFGSISTLGNILFVSKAVGNNTTGAKGDLSKPYADPWAAKDAAVAGDVIHVLDGMFTFGNETSGADKASDTDVSIHKHGVKYVFEDGSGLASAGTSVGVWLDVPDGEDVDIDNITLDLTTGNESSGDSAIMYRGATNMKIVFHDYIRSYVNDPNHYLITDGWAGTSVVDIDLRFKKASFGTDIIPYFALYGNGRINVEGDDMIASAIAFEFLADSPDATIDSGTIKIGTLKGGFLCWSTDYNVSIDIENQIVDCATVRAEGRTLEVRPVGTVPQINFKGNLLADINGANLTEVIRFGGVNLVADLNAVITGTSIGTTPALVHLYGSVNVVLRGFIKGPYDIKTSTGNYADLSRLTFITSGTNSIRSTSLPILVEGFLSNKAYGTLATPIGTYYYDNAIPY